MFSVNAIYENDYLNYFFLILTRFKNITIFFWLAHSNIEDYIYCKNEVKKLMTLVNKKCPSLKKYRTSLILGRWFRIPQYFLMYDPVFAVLPVLRFFGRKLHFRKYFEILKKINFYFFIWKRNKIVSKKNHPNRTNGLKVIVLRS